MTLGEFLAACKNTDTLFTISDGSNTIGTMTADSNEALSATVTAYTVTEFTLASAKAVNVTVSTT